MTVEPSTCTNKRSAHLWSVSVTAMAIRSLNILATAELKLIRNAIVAPGLTVNGSGCLLVTWKSSSCVTDVITTEVLELLESRITASAVWPTPTWPKSILVGLRAT